MATCCWQRLPGCRTWTSALTENQILAYLATFGALLVAYIMDGIQTMFTTGNLLAFIAFMVVVLIASILVGVICKRLTAGVTVFCVGAVVLFILFRLHPAWLLTAFNAVLSALALFDPFQDIVGGMFSIPAIVYYLSVIGAVPLPDRAGVGTPPLELRRDTL